MAIIYDESVKSVGGKIDISRMNGTKQYLKHFENKLYLSFMAKNGDRNEKWQAEKELTICERKLKFWERHPNFEPMTAQSEMERIKKMWRA